MVRLPKLATVTGVAFGLWGLQIGLRPLSDNSFLTHLATGRLILSDGLPRADVYSFTAPGEAWVVQSWLASWVYAVIERLAGSDGLQLLNAALGATLALLVWRLTLPARSLVGRIVPAALALAVGTVGWVERPLFIGLVLMALILVLLDGRRAEWAALPVMFLWVNVHGSFPLALVAIVAFAGGAWLDSRERPDHELRVLKWAVGGVALGVLNPLGPALLIFPIKLLGKTDTLQLIVEWQSPSFASSWTRAFLLQVVLVVIFLVRRPSYRAAVPAVVFIAAALLGLRNVAVASIVLVPVLATLMADVGAERGDRRGRVPAVAMAGLVLLAAMAVQSALSTGAYDFSRYPVGAVAWQDAAGLRGDDVRMATSDVAGNYIDAVYGPEARVFIDDRYDMFPRSIVDDYLVLLQGRPGVNEVLDRWEIDLVVWEREKPLSSMLVESGDWSVGYQDQKWVGLCRRASSVAPLCG